jgi:phage terminase small subunit
VPGPRPQPTHLRLLRGNPSTRPINKNEPRPERPSKVPEPPQFFDDYARAHWAEVAPELWALGLLTGPDLSTFSAYCVAYSEWRNATEVLNRMAANDAGTFRGFIVKSEGGGVSNTKGSAG